MTGAMLIGLMSGFMGAFFGVVLIGRASRSGSMRWAVLGGIVTGMNIALLWAIAGWAILRSL